MLSEQIKSDFRRAISLVIDELGIELVAEVGPVAIVDNLINKSLQAGFPEQHENIKANRAEAEQFIAGLLGMA